MYPKVSVVVSVYNGEKTLSLCLDSLIALNYPKEHLEIIVVDNNSTDKTKEIIKRYPVEYIFEEKRNVSLARNKGINQCTGEFIAFTDADCIVDKDWIKNIIEPLKDKNIGGIGGRILPYNPQNWIEKYIDCKTSYRQWCQIEDQEYFLPWLITANAVFTKESLRRVGLFDSVFSLPAGEDIDLTARVILAGYNIGYTPDAIVYHKHRDNLIKFYKWRFKNGRAVPYLYIKYQYIIKKDPRDYLLEDILGTFLAFFRRIIIKRDIQDKAHLFLDITGKMAYYFGYFLGCLEVAFGIKKISSLSTDNAKDIFWWNRGDGLTVLNLCSSPIAHYNLNETGKRIWELLFIHNRSTEDIADILAEEHEEQKETVKADLQNFLSDLERAGILKEQGKII